MIRKKVLWIEDAAISALHLYLAPMYMSGLYETDIALNATEAVERLRSDRYDAVVVDIRIPPGTDPNWRKIYKHHNRDVKKARLGLLLIEGIFQAEYAEYVFQDPPDWVDPSRFGVLTVERQRDIQAALANVGVKVMHRKDGQDGGELLKVVEYIIANQRK